MQPPSATPLTPAFLPVLQHPAALTLKGLLPPSAPEVEQDAIGHHRDRQFTSMLRSFRETGGLMRGDELAALLQQRRAGDVSQLARWIVAGQVLSFDWRGELWVPLFQFDLVDMSIRTEVSRIVTELESGLDGWAMANWFASPNEMLRDQPPADLVAKDPEAVVQAARAGRAMLAIVDVPPRWPAVAQEAPRRPGCPGSGAPGFPPARAADELTECWNRDVAGKVGRTAREGGARRLARPTG